MKLVLALALAATACSGPSRFLGATMPAMCKKPAPGTLDGERCVGWISDRIAVVSSDDEYPDPALHAYVTEIAARVAHASHLAMPIVRIIDHDPSMAYARPGFVYVTRDLIAVLETEAELAAVVAHEMAHNAAGHVGDVMDSDPPPADVGGDLREQRRRDDEATADELAVTYLVAAGYAPAAMRTALVALDRANLALEAATAGKSSPAASADAVSSAGGVPAAEPIDDDRHAFPPVVDGDDPEHPTMPQRIARVSRMIDGRTQGEWGAERYRAHVAGLVVGTDPRRGILIGSTWRSTRLGLAVDLPPGWELDGTSDQVAGRDKKMETSVAAIGRSWGEAVVSVMEHRRRTEIAGHPAVVGIAAPDKPTSDPIAVNPPAAGSAIVVVMVGPRALMLTVSGPDADHQLAFVISRVRAIRKDEIAASAPARLGFRAAPAAGRLGDLVKQLCGLPDQSASLGDMSRRIAAGDAVKCVDK